MPALSDTAGLKVDTWMARYLFLLRRIHSPAPCQFIVGTLICNDGWGDAWKNGASQTTHQDFLIGVLAVSFSR